MLLFNFLLSASVTRCHLVTDTNNFINYMLELQRVHIYFHQLEGSVELPVGRALSLSKPFVSSSPCRPQRLVRRGEGGGGGIVGSFILLYTFSDHSHNYKVIYIVHRFMYVHYVFILKYRDVVVTVTRS